MRLIDADALIAKWEEDAKHIEVFDHRGMVYAAINELKNAPTVDPKPKWIPVTERLPEPYTQDILVTVDNGGKYIDVLSYDTPGDGTYEVKWYKTDSDGYPLIFDDVVAWMYMKPWKGGAE